MFILKVNVFAQRSQLVVESIVDGSSEIVWLVGLRASGRVKVTEDTKKILMIKVLYDDEDNVAPVGDVRCHGTCGKCGQY